MIPIIAVTATIAASLGSRDVASEDGNFPFNASRSPLLLEKSKLAESGYVHRIKLDLNVPDGTPAFSSMQLLLATYQQKVPHATVTLFNEERTCVYGPQSSVAVVDNGFLNLAKIDCADEVFAATPDFILEIQTPNDVSIALWGSPKGNADPSTPYLEWPGPDAKYIPVGKYVIAQKQNGNTETTKVAELLSRMWNNGDISPSILSAIVGFAIFFVLLGILGLMTARSPKFIALGFFMISSGLGCTYAVLVPPYQAPDEADHIITYLGLAARSDLKADALKIAHASHYNQIICSIHEKYSVKDSQAPAVMGWPRTVGDTGMDKRSLAGRIYWQFLAKILPAKNMNTLHVAIRLSNALIFASLSALALWLFYSGASSAVPLMATVPMLIVPTLFFFVSHVSNHVLLISAYAISGLFAFHIFRPVSQLKDFIFMGVVLGLAVASGRAGFILFFIWVAMHSVATMQVYLDGRSNGFSVFDWIMRTVFLLGPAVGMWLIFDNSMTQFSRIASSLGYRAGIAVVAVTVGVAGVWFSAKKWPLVQQTTKKSLAWISLAAAVLSVLIMMMPLAIPTKALSNIERIDPRISGFSYALAVVKSFFGNWGLGGDDFYLIRSFWAGFGCPEPVVALWLTQLLSASLLAAVGISFWRAWRSGDPKEQFVTVSVALICVLYLGLLAYATASLTSPFNLHGRYMIGFYLLSLTFFGGRALEYFSGWLQKKTKHFYLIMAFIFGLTTVTVHALSINMLLTRYFGA